MPLSNLYVFLMSIDIKANYVQSETIFNGSRRDAGKNGSFRFDILRED